VARITAKRLYRKVLVLAELVRDDRDTIGELAAELERVSATLTRHEVRISSQSDALGGLSRAFHDRTDHLA
jgi:hypothetical protein